MQIRHIFDSTLLEYYRYSYYRLIESNVTCRFFDRDWRSTYQVQLDYQVLREHESSSYIGVKHDEMMCHVCAAFLAIKFHGFVLCASV